MAASSNQPGISKTLESRVANALRSLESCIELLDGEVDLDDLHVGRHESARGPLEAAILGCREARETIRDWDGDASSLFTQELGEDRPSAGPQGSKRR